MLEIAEEIRKGGGDLASLHEKIDSTSPMGQLMFTIMVALSQFEREQIAERTREAMKAHMKAGRMMGSKPPYGWKQDPADPKRMLKEAFEQESLEIMLKMRRARSSYNVIMKYMEFKGRKGRNGKPWDIGTLGAILRRELAEEQRPL
jgi:site-specific DNA recombinase